MTIYCDFIDCPKEACYSVMNRPPIQCICKKYFCIDHIIYLVYKCKVIRDDLRPKTRINFICVECALNNKTFLNTINILRYYDNSYTNILTKEDVEKIREKPIVLTKRANTS